MKQKLKDGFEYDWVSLNSRRFHRWGAGVGKYIKHNLNKRNRKDGKKAVQEELKND